MPTATAPIVVPPPTPAGVPPCAAPPRAPKVVRVGVLGLGNVGSALCDLLAAEADGLARRHGVAFRVETALVRDVARPRRSLPLGAVLASSVEDFLARRHDVVVEVLGGVEPAATIVAALLARGTSVVTANKALLAERGASLRAIAAASGAALRIEASVAAGIPLFSLLERALATTRVAAVTAILNGTSNFVLSRVARGGTFEAALDEARRRGCAERDASLDLSGIDAAQKLRVLAATLSGRDVPASRISVRGIEGVRATDCSRAAAVGHRLRPVARARFDVPEPSGWVAPAAVPEGHPLASADGTDNGVLLEGEPLGSLFLAGPGAGPRPTAASLLDDLLAVARGDARRPAPPLPSDSTSCDASEPNDVSRWLVAATPATHGPGVPQVLEFLRAEGLVLRRLVEIEESGGPVLLCVTEEAAPDRVERVGASLLAVSAVREFRAFRAVPPVR